ncbi:MAG: hypothetical protein ACI854_000005 [Arenicella sp.]|jgi:hypothetical protein
MLLYYGDEPFPIDDVMPLSVIMPSHSERSPRMSVSFCNN